MNNRIITLLEKINLIDRYVDLEEETFLSQKQLSSNRIDWKEVDCKVDAFREESTEFLKYVLYGDIKGRYGGNDE